MRLAFQNTVIGFYEVVRITDNGASSDTYAQALLLTLASAQEFVNKGANGSGHSGKWAFNTIVGGDYTITASQT